MKEKIKIWFKSLTKETLALVMLVTVVASIWYYKQVTAGNMENPVKAIVEMMEDKEVVAVAPVVKVAKVAMPKVDEDKEPVCSPGEAKLVLSDSLIAKSMNLFVADLNTYHIKKRGSTRSYHTKEQLYSVTREYIPKDAGKPQIYLTILEPVTKLNYNKDDFNTSAK